MSQGENFFGVYLLYCLNPKYKGRTYIGYTRNPNRHLKQLNRGTSAGGASQTDNKGPWKMVLIVHGFPNNVSALRFEWAWQNPSKTIKLQHLCLKKIPRKESDFQFKLRILSEMLQVGPWDRLPLLVRWLEKEFYEDIPASIFANNIKSCSTNYIAEDSILANAHEYNKECLLEDVATLTKSPTDYLQNEKNHGYGNATNSVKDFDESSQRKAVLSKLPASYSQEEDLMASGNMIFASNVSTRQDRNQTTFSESLNITSAEAKEPLGSKRLLEEPLNPNKSAVEDGSADPGSGKSSKKKKCLSGAAKRRLAWWMARGKTFEEAKILCIQPLQDIKFAREEMEERKASIERDRAERCTISKRNASNPQEKRKPVEAKSSEPQQLPSKKARRAEARAKRRRERKNMVAESKLRKAAEGPTKAHAASVSTPPTQSAGASLAAGKGNETLAPQSGAVDAPKRSNRPRPRGKRGGKKVASTIQGDSEIGTRTERSKRARPDDTQSPREGKRPKTAPSPATTNKRSSYADVAKGKDLAIAVTTEPFYDLTGDQADKILEAMDAALDEEIFRESSSSTRAPSFRGKPFLGDGVLKLCCEDDYSLEWFRRTIQKFSSPRPGTRLVVCRQSEVPQRVKGSMFVPAYTDKILDTLRLRLKRQNPWYDVDQWSVYLAEQQDDKSGVFFDLGIPQSQVDIIKSRDRRVSYKYGTVYIKFPKEASESGFGETKTLEAASESKPALVRMDETGDLGPHPDAPLRQPRHSSPKQGKSGAVNQKSADVDPARESSSIPDRWDEARELGEEELLASSDGPSSPLDH